ncbi:Gluconate 2-dehydrogenase subunit 3 [Rhodonellum ikkaensis]|nr:Gluconate 2-dehydrogenase subunit 3 [Rhodonellum ikkaensis]
MFPIHFNPNDQTMKRRDALRSLALITGGLVLVPACDFSKDDILSAYKNLNVTTSQQKLLAQIADTIIPAGYIKGASDLAVQDFILVMVNDCVDSEGQKSFSDGLSAFDAFSKKSGGKVFDKLEVPQREQVLKTVLASEGEEDKTIRAFLNTTKRFTIQGFMMSEYIMTNVKPYSLIPGDYNGEVLIADLKSEKING